MPNRIIKESIKTSTEIDKLSWFEECVFYRLMVSVDDYGCFDGRAIVIRNELFPTRDNITTSNISKAIKRLEQANLLTCYEVDGRPYIHLKTWESHQRVRNKHRKYPEPPLVSELPTNDRQMTDNCLLESNPIQSNIESNTEIESKPKKKAFVPPTLEEVKAYCDERNSTVDPKVFFDYFDTGKWIDSLGNPVKNWKQKLITWEQNNKGTPKKDEPRKKSYEEEANEWKNF